MTLNWRPSSTLAHRALFCAMLLLCSTLIATPELIAQEKGVSVTLSGADLDALKGTLDTLCTKGDLAKTRVGVHVVDLSTAQVLYARDADALYNPASNMKMMTSAAALDLFGPAHTFSTTLSTDARAGDTVSGDLFLYGTGEGFILYEDVLDWAASIKNQGITTIKGDIIVGDGPFKGGEYLPPGFEQKQEDASYRAPIGAVSINFNATTLNVSPGAKPGDAPLLTLDPPNDHVVIDSSLKTVAGKSRRFNVKSVPSEDGQGTTLKISGSVGVSASSWSTRKRIDNPPIYAGSVLKHALEDVGIKVLGNVKRGEPTTKGKLIKLVTHGSEPLTELIMAMNKWSNNFMAEQLFRSLGTHASTTAERGTWGASTEILGVFMERAGLTSDSFKIKNGSGLYAGNALSPKAITTMLSYMHNHIWAVEYMASLAIGGEDGTLSKRFKSSKGMIRGKTGTLNEVSALSGYITTKSGRTLAVSILFNDPPTFAWRLRNEQDAIAQALIDFER